MDKEIMLVAIPGFLALIGVVFRELRGWRVEDRNFQRYMRLNAETRQMVQTLFTACQRGGVYFRPEERELLNPVGERAKREIWKRL